MYPTARIVAYFFLVVTSALWGSNAVAARGLLNTLSPETLALLRWSVAVLALLPFVWSERSVILRALRYQWRVLLLLAALGFAPNALLSYYGLRGTTAIFMGLMNSIVPGMVVLLMIFWKKRIPQYREGIGLALSFTGVFIVLMRGDVYNLLQLRVSGFDFIVLAGLMLWAVYTILLLNRPPNLSLAAFVFLAGLLGLFLIAPAVITDWAQNGIPRVTPKELMLASYIGLAPTLLAMLLYGYAVGQVGPVQSGIFTHLVPLFSALFAVLFINESLHLYHAAGFVLVVGGAILCCLKPDTTLSDTKNPAGRNAHNQR
ncbi:MAG: DMT family transporter [Burkholderiales bacterium]|jgi:drug/metabolite transporter (DMT)-like permease|nr:DMT family transporter [Burkholderiales bacterium]